jgi:hypothetical protein
VRDTCGPTPGTDCSSSSRAPGGAGLDGGGQVALDPLDVAVEVVDVPLDVRADGPGGGGQAVLLADAHLHELAAAGQQIAQRAGLGVGDGARFGADGLGEVGQDRGIERVGLGQPADAFGVAARLAGVDDGGREARGGEGGHDRDLVAAGGLQDEGGRLQLPEPAHQLGDAGLVVGHPEGQAEGPGMDVEVVLGDVDASPESGGGHGRVSEGVGPRARPG